MFVDFLIVNIGANVSLISGSKRHRAALKIHEKFAAFIVTLYKF